MSAIHREPPAAFNSSSGTASPRPIRILALVEAVTLTGVARSVLGFAEAFRPDRAEPGALTLSIVITARGATLDVPLARAARDAGAEVDALVERRRFDLRTVRHLRQLCARFQPDVIQSHAVKSHVLVWLAGLRHRHVWIAFHHGYTYTDLKTRAYNALDRATLRHAHQVVTVAEAFRADLVGCGVDEARLSVLHNAAPSYRTPAPGVCDRLRERLRLPTGTQVIASAGRLSVEKGHTHLIRAFARVRARVPPTHLVIVGEGPERRRLEHQIVRGNLQRHVTLLGEVEDVSPLYQVADLFALPSMTEGCPSVLLEAMAAGVPVVATRVGGIPEIVSDGRTALLVRAGEVEELAHAMARMLLDQPLARTLTTEALRHVTENHDSTRRAMALAAIHYRALEHWGGGFVGAGRSAGGAFRTTGGGTDPCGS